MSSPTKPDRAISSGAKMTVTHIIDVDTNRVNSRLHLRSYDGLQHDEEMPRSDLLSPMQANARLANAPVNVPHLTKVDVEKLMIMTPRNTIRQTRRPGWRKAHFAFPTRQFSSGEGALHFCSELSAPPALRPLYRAKGSTGDWSAAMRPLIRRSDFVTFAIGVVLASPLISVVGVSEGAIFNLLGRTGGGKTLVLLLAQSVMGKADRSKLPSWDHTATGLEHHLEALGELACLLDDTSRDRGKRQDRSERLAGAGHLMAGGSRKRSEIYDAQRPAIARPAQFGLSSGEEALNDLARHGGSSLVGGELPRFIDIPVPPPESGGIFNRCRPAGLSSEQLAERAERAAKSFYGTPFLEYLDYLESLQPQLQSYISGEVSKFLTSWRRSRPEGLIDKTDIRIARKFALVYAALRIFETLGQSPVSAKQARRAVRFCLDAALTHRREGDQNLNRALEKLRQTLSDPVQCPLVAKGQSPLGSPFKRDTHPNGFPDIFISPGDLFRIAELSGDPTESTTKLAKALRASGHLQTAGQSFTKQVRIGNKRQRFYVISGSFCPPTPSCS